MGSAGVPTMPLDIKWSTLTGESPTTENGFTAVTQGTSIVNVIWHQKRNHEKMAPDT